MGVFDKASLALVPDGIKDGKLYSIKPTDGSGDFTFTRGSNLAATRVNENGLIEKGRENLLLQSNQFDTTWTTSNASVTSGQSGYDGSSDAWLLEAASDGSGRRVQQSKTQGDVATLSIYAKAGTTNWLRIEFGGAASLVYFDLTNGVLGSESNAIGKIESVGNGWYRCSAINTSASTPTTMRYHLASNDNSIAVLTGDNIYIQDAQLEQGLVATDYIETGASTAQAGVLEDLPRIDYTGGTPSLLLEPSRTNLVTNSEYYGSNLFVNSSPETNNTTSPEGLQNATLLKEDTNNGNHAMREPSNINIAADDSQYVISFFAKSNGRNIRFIDDGYAGSNTIVNFNLSSGGTFSNGAGVIDADAVAIGTDGWYRCYAVIDKSNASQSSFRFSLRLLGGASNDSDSYTGDGTSGVWIYGKEVNDAVSYPTSYIPTYGAAATRSRDFKNLNNLISLGIINNDTFTYFIELNCENIIRDSSFVAIQIGAGSQRILFYNSSPTEERRFAIFIQDGTTQTYTLSTDIVKVCISVQPNSVKVFENGVNVLSTTQNLDLTSNSNYTMYGNNRAFELKQILFFPEALSDAECITLTT